MARARSLDMPDKIDEIAVNGRVLFTASIPEIEEISSQLVSAQGIERRLAYRLVLDIVAACPELETMFDFRYHDIKLLGEFVAAVDARAQLKMARGEGVSGMHYLSMQELLRELKEKNNLP